MKKLLVPAVIGLSAMTILSGCSIQLGTGQTTRLQSPTVGQQLIDLQRAKDTGVITTMWNTRRKQAKLLMAH